jgi:hypothetical protein
MNKFIKALFLSVLGIVFLTASLGAQAPTSKLQGTVTDGDGNALPGVSVEATSPKLIGKATAVTDANGAYRLLSLPPGVYEVTFTLQGFKPVSRKEIVLRIEETLRLDIKMEIGTLEEQITVVGQSPLIDVKSTVKGMTMTKETFQILPKGRNFDTLVTAVAGVNNESMLGGISVDGASGAENMFYIDGMDITNMRYGTRGQSAAFEFVDEIQIKASGFEAEFGGALGGVVNVITRQGGNEYHGEVLGYYSGSSLNGKERDSLRLNPFDESKAEYVNYQDLYGKDKTDRIEAGFSLGGYIFKDRLWFFGSFLPVFSPVKRHVEYLTTPVVAGDYKQTNEAWNFQAKLTAQPVSFMRVGASFVNNFSKYKGDLPPRDGTGSPANPWANYGWSYPNWTATGTMDLTFGGNFMVNVRGGSFSIDTTDPLQAPDSPRWMIRGSGTAFYPEIPAQYQRPIGYANRGRVYLTKVQQRTRSYLGSDFTYFLNLGGEHAWKGGVRWERKRENVDSSVNFPEVTLNWNLPCIQLGRNYGQGKYGHYVVRGNDATGPFGSFYNVYMNSYSIYLQDSWTIANRFTLNLGVRSEYEYIPSYSADPSVKDIRPITFDFKEKIAPRAGFIWDVKGDASLKVFGNYGLYIDTFKLYMASDAYGGFKSKAAYYTLDSYEWDQIGINNNYPGNLLAVIGSREWNEFDSTDPNLKPMSQEEFTLGAEKMIMENVSATVRGVYKHLRYAIEDVGVIVPDLGEVYYTTNPGYGYSRLTTNGGKFDPAYPETPRAKRDYYAINFTLDKRLSKNWLAGFSYTWSSLVGNYSGLASSDEEARLAPYVERNFDIWNISRDYTLNELKGALPTDRTHFFKLYGAYTFPFHLTVGAVFNAYSGIPVSEVWNYLGADCYPYNRGFLKDDSGNLVKKRTPFLFFGNLYAEYNLKMGRNTLQFNVNVDNMFDTKTATRIYSSRYLYGLDVTEEQALAHNWTPEEAGAVRNDQWLKKYGFYAPISARFGVKFIF